MSAYAELVARGCLCGTERIADCPVHTKPNDLRGIAAFFKAGQPTAFPMAANCSVCGADSLIYPSAELDRGDVPAGQAPGPTLVCPSCSSPATERALAREADEFGYRLNERRVFGLAAAA